MQELPKNKPAARLIQDVQPQLPPKRPLGAGVEQGIRQFHQATQLSNIPSSRAVRRVQSFDILMPRGPHRPKPTRLRPQPKAVAKPAQPAKRSFWRRLGEFAQYPVIAIVAIGSAYSSTAGQAIIGIYLLVALASRLSSRYTFGAALLLLASVPGFQLIHQTGVSQNAAIYTYELLVVGTLQAIIEAWLDSRRGRKHSRAEA